ncbi:hypothetical protein [Vibrio gallaecicus]|uniref:hypothetical protein n=1 Tax=Vibrio gallaecicus TaxID=552386 RepID=UPI0025B4C87B|nr:hypothetical protein [Vibrio gallaecicus]MDN3616210.1 hypothetical protein [Vibrio gallaecicus]
MLIRLLRKSVPKCDDFDCSQSEIIISSIILCQSHFLELQLKDSPSKKSFDPTLISQVILPVFI